MLICRNAREADRPGINAILSENNMGTLKVCNPFPQYVAELDGELSGTGGFGTPFSDSTWLHTIATKKRHHRKGVGRAIVEANLQLAADQGIEQIFLGTRFHNIEFYRKFGFAVIEKRNIGDPIARLRLSDSKEIFYMTLALA